MTAIAAPEVHTFHQRPPDGGEWLLVGIIVSNVGEMEWWIGWLEKGVLHLRGASNPNPVTIETAKARRWLWALLPVWAEEIDENWWDWLNAPDLEADA